MRTRFASEPAISVGLVQSVPTVAIRTLGTFVTEGGTPVPEGECRGQPATVVRSASILVENSDASATNWLMSRYVNDMVRDTPSMVVYGSVCEKLKVFWNRPVLMSAAMRLPLPMKFVCTKFRFKMACCEPE